jgi:hypothetical protein
MRFCQFSEHARSPSFSTSLATGPRSCPCLLPPPVQVLLLLRDAWDLQRIRPPPSSVLLAAALSPGPACCRSTRGTRRAHCIHRPLPHRPPPATAHRPPPTADRPPPTAHRPPPTADRPPPTAHHPPVAASRRPPPASASPGGHRRLLRSNQARPSPTRRTSAPCRLLHTPPCARPPGGHRV